MQIINKKGFSFLELMIVIAIAGIMTAVMMVSLNAQRDKKTVESAAREVAAVIRETQTYALTGKDLKSIGPAGCSYSFSWTAGIPPDYGITGCKIQSYTLKNGVTFSGSSGSFSFSVPFATLSPSSNADIILNKNGNLYHVCVYASGIVSEKLNGC